MRCPKCHVEQSEQNTICEACQLVFEKYYEYQKAQVNAIVEDVQSYLKWKHLFFPEPSPRAYPNTIVRSLFLIFLLIYSLKLIFAGIDGNNANQAFIHLPNLAFHEAGHVFFGILGQFIGSLGGTIGQFLMPTICFYVFFV